MKTAMIKIKKVAASLALIIIVAIAGFFGMYKSLSQ
jgi:hypothetical protein